MAQLADEILAALDPEQRAVATAVRGPVCVIAGAGTGKTRAITHRLAYAVDIGIVEPNRILALTFTARAAGEMRARLRTLGVPAIAARTFHAAALKQLLYFWPEALGGRFPSLLTSKSAFLGEALDRAGVTITKSPATLREISSEIEWAKVLQIPSDEYVEAALSNNRLIRSTATKSKLNLEDIARTYESYETLKRQERAIDFEDVLLLTVGMLEEVKEIRDRVRDQYRYFTVDEYQDVSPLQQRLLDLWLGKRSDICVVGDPAQTIYSFAGATPSFLLNFTKRFPEAEVIRLSAGYRSTPEIINIANAILRSGDLGHDLDAVNEHGDQPETSGFSSESEELISIVDAIRSKISSGVKAHEIAVLARTNAQLEDLEKALAGAGIENQIRTAERFFERGDVRAMISAIRSASVLATSDWLSELRDLLKQFGEGDKYVRSIIQLAQELINDGVDSMRAFLRELEERAEQNNPPDLPGVTLATLHSAKGLEWEYVYLVGASARYLPWPGSSVDEERRLFYVGVTRAKRELNLSYAGEASPFIASAGLAV
jgi:DNA helicase-2/ATP-dependent DNA helicase PcrA